jgi:hypothetical protein
MDVASNQGKREQKFGSWVNGEAKVRTSAKIVEKTFDESREVNCARLHRVFFRSIRSGG